MQQNEQYAFCAMLSRMKYITRWGLMRATRTESLSEHTAEAAITAHVLALIERDLCGNSDVRPEKIAVAALYHDAGEILTGDMPTPVKYKNDALKAEYKKVERESAGQLSTMLPPPLSGELRPLLTADALNDAEKRVLKAADVICALAKCVEEENSGNNEFKRAKEQQLAKLSAMDMPCVKVFLDQFLPCYTKTLDELVENG